MTGLLSKWVGTLTKRIRIQKILSGILGFSGTVTAIIQESFVGSIKMTSSLVARPIVTETMYYGVENP